MINSKHFLGKLFRLVSWTISAFYIIYIVIASVAIQNGFSWSTNIVVTAVGASLVILGWLGQTKMTYLFSLSGSAIVMLGLFLESVEFFGLARSGAIAPEEPILGAISVTAIALIFFVFLLNAVMILKSLRYLRQLEITVTGAKTP